MASASRESVFGVQTSTARKKTSVRPTEGQSTTTPSRCSVRKGKPNGGEVAATALQLMRTRECPVGPPAERPGEGASNGHPSAVAERGAALGPVWRHSGGRTGVRSLCVAARPLDVSTSGQADACASLGEVLVDVCVRAVAGYLGDGVVAIARYAEGEVASLAFG